MCRRFTSAPGYRVSASGILTSNLSHSLRIRHPASPVYGTEPPPPLPQKNKIKQNTKTCPGEAPSPPPSQPGDRAAHASRVITGKTPRTSGCRLGRSPRQCRRRGSTKSQPGTRHCEGNAFRPPFLLLGNKLLLPPPPPLTPVLHLLCHPSFSRPAKAQGMKWSRLALASSLATGVKVQKFGGLTLCSNV